MLHLKTIVSHDRKFALLITPNLAGKVRDNLELYEAIIREGKATIHEFDASSMRLKTDYTVLTAQEFCSVWQGD